MTLEDWRLQEGLTNKALAELVSSQDQQVSEETVRRWQLPESSSIHRRPDGPQMRRIFAITGGMVTPNDFAGIQE